MTSVAQPKGKAGSTKAQIDEAPHRRPAATHQPVPPPLQAIVEAKDRTEADRQLDASRHPGELLAFLGLRPGMRVAELSAGGGYTTELLARAVGPTGKVWAQNNAPPHRRAVGDPRRGACRLHARRRRRLPA